MGINMAANLGSLNVLLGLDSAQFTTALSKADHQGALFARKLEKEFGSTSVAADKLTKSVSGIDKSLARMATIQIAPILYRIAKEGVGAADAYGQYSSRLQQATESTEEFKAVQAQLLDTSNRVYKNYEDANELFIRTNSALKELGYGAKEAADLVSTIQFGLTVDSADTQKTKSVIDAISKSILTGKMSMDQFNTVVAVSPSLFQALADSVAGGSQQALRNLVANGKLTANELLKITSQMKGLGERADDMPATVADAFIKLRNYFAAFSGELNEATGATQFLVGGIDLVATNIQGLTAATATYFGIGFAAKLYESGKATYMQVAASKQQLLVEKEIAQVKAHRLGITVKEMQADIAKMSGISRLVAVERQLVPLQRQHAEAIALATKATQTYASATGFLSKSLSLLGGPLGLVTLGLTAASFFAFSSSAEEAGEATESLTEKVDALRTSIELLDAAQAKQAAVEVQKKYDEQAEVVMKYASQIEYLRIQLETYPRNTMLDEWNKSLVQAEGNLSTANKELEALGSRLSDLKGRVKQASTELNKFDLTPKGMEKWDEYLKNLEDARNVVGLNARQLGEYQARRKGASEEEARVAGIVSAQTSAFGDLQSAIQDKDAKAAQAAKDNIRNLERERIQVYYLAQEMLAIMEAANQFAISGVSPDVAMGAIAKIKETFALAREGALAGVDKQIANLENNTIPKTTKSKGGGSKSQNDELKNLTKSLQEQIAVLGMTDTEAQKYKISQMQGSEAAKVMAASLVDTIARHREEAETLKQNSALFEELAVFRNQQFEPLMMMGMGDRARDQMSELLSIQADYAAKRRELSENQESESTRISDAAYQVRLDKLIEAENQKLAVIEEAYRLRQEKEANWSLGVSEALNNYSSEAANVYQSMNNAVSGAFKGMEDALVSFVTTGKADFKSLANSIISDMVRIAVQQSIMGPLANALGGMFGGSHSFGGAGTVASVGHNFTMGGFATGGYTGHGSKYDPAGIVHRGEGVLSQEDMRSLGGVYGFNLLRRQLRGYSTGGVAGRVPGAPAIHGGRSQGSVQVNISIQDGKTQTNAPAGMERFGKQIGEFVESKFKELEARSYRQGGTAWQHKQGVF